MINLDNLVAAIYQAVLSASDALADKNLEILDTYFEPSEEGEPTKLQPKTVVIQYPQVTAKGVNVHDVHVPLIALIPVNMTQISEVKMRTSLEVTLEEGQLKVAFSPSTGDNDSGDDNQGGNSTSNATLDITLSPTTTPDGLKKLIEGYEKALRAQIPG